MESFLSAKRKSWRGYVILPSSAFSLLKRIEPLISSEDARTVMDRADEMKELRGNHFRELYDNKSTEAEQARNEIDAAVQDWKDKWYEGLENE